ncbi:hypothetical protein SPBR_03851 [Sporothrix brasiliensis 5110]|uniref:Uncharacterized protein n=1 Tax=Sporothrix brasiliensis 5110 TaxID=1398154 RepID=A0A0C2F7D7_9PEZI|nr:uncharacterized protein SPBR_03851 [Sporothrix brasiliensis 5110]KIH94874.1 hypothetical protein SPBR_03851 [Sporothrix brasiliensis 5110]
MFGVFKKKQSSGSSRRRYQQPAFPENFAPDFTVRPGDSYIAAASAAEAYLAEADFVMRHDHTSYDASQPFQPDFAKRPGHTYNAAQPVSSSTYYDTDFAPRVQDSYNAGQPLTDYNATGSGIYAQPTSLSFAPIPSSDPAPGLHRSNATRKASTSSHRTTLLVQRAMLTRHTQYYDCVEYQ